MIRKAHETMSKRTSEQYFTAIKADMDEFRSEVNNRFDRVERAMQSILSVVQMYDAERKEVKATLWEHDRKLIKLEKLMAN